MSGNTGLDSVSDTRSLLHGLFEDAPVGYLVYDINGTCIAANRAFRDLFGAVPPPEYNLLKDEALVHNGVLAQVHRAIAGERVHIPPHWYDPRQSSQAIPSEVTRVGVELNIFPLRDSSGAVAHLGFCFRDATAELELEERARELRESEANKIAMLEASLDCVLTIDRDGRVTEFNPAAVRTFGYSREQAIGRSLAELIIPPRMREQHQRGLARYLATNEPTILGKRIEIEAMRADGTEFPVELAVVPTRLGNSLFFTGFLRDITERRQAAEALRVSQERFRHLWDSGIIGIIVTTLSGDISDANDAFLQSVGYTRDELQGGLLKWTELTPTEWRDRDTTAIAELSRTNVARPWEKEYFHKDGSRVPVLVGVAMLDATNAVGFVLDLAEQKRAEAEALLQSAGRAEAVAALRQTEEQLRRAQKMEAIGTLAGSIAHDFNNLLTVVLSYSHVLLSSLPEGDPLREDVEQIAHAGDRANELTRQLLAFGRRQVQQPRVLLINDSIRQMHAMVRRLIGENIELNLVLNAEHCAVRVDPGQLEQVVLNLLINARDAMPEGGQVTISTTTLVVDEAEAARRVGLSPGKHVRLSVTDTGHGMSKETQERVFEPFFTTKEQGKGTGLGLSTVFGIVTQSGGHVEVRSELGRGATFDVWLPLVENEQVIEMEPRRPVAGLRGSETVLLVEDDAQVRGLALAVLRRHGYHVLEAASGGDALLICEQFAGKIDLLLTDVVMPRLSGRQLWERLAPLRPEMQVLFMSGYTNDAVLLRGVINSDFEFVQKPLLPETLLTKVRMALTRPRRAVTVP